MILTTSATESRLVYKRTVIFGGLREGFQRAYNTRSPGAYHRVTQEPSTLVAQELTIPVAQRLTKSYCLSLLVKAPYTSDRSWRDNSYISIYIYIL